MGQNELIIKISGDIEDYQAKLKAAEQETEGLKDVLDTTAKYSAIGFAALSAEIVFATHQFGEAEISSRKLSLALQNQGIYHKDLIADYSRQADAISRLTGIDNDSIKNAQAVAQTYLGRTKITQEMTQAIVDLSVAEETSLASAAEKVAKSIGTSTNAFARQGLELDGVTDKQERYRRVLEFVQGKADGFAESANKGVGGVRGLKTALGELNEALGEQFANSATAAIELLTNLIYKIRDNESLVKFTAAFLAGAAAITFFIAVAAKIGAVLVTITTLMTAFGIAVTAAKVAVVLLAGATGIGLLVVGLGLLGGYLINTSASMRSFKGDTEGAKEEVKRLKEEMAKVAKEGPGIAEKFRDLFSVTTAQEDRQNTIAQLEAQIKAEEEKEAKRLEKNSEAAKRLENQKASNRSREIAALDAHNAVLQAKVDDESAMVIESLQKEADLKGQIAQATNKEQIRLLEELYTEQAALTEQYRLEDEERRLEFEALRRETDEALREQDMETTAIFRESELKELEAHTQSKADIAKKMAKQEFEERAKSRAQFLEDEKKFGTAYALINQAMHSAIYVGTKTAFGELAQLQQSNNSTLKSIGKAAAIANIIIRTAESAMNIYAGFSAIPIIGPVLGAAGAAAAIAFGAEQVGKVNAAAEGGLLRGGIPGQDSIPVLAQDMELISPAQNFDEVIGSVRAGREAKKFMPDGEANTGVNEEQLALLRSIDDKLSNQRAPTQVNVNGDVLAEDTFIQRIAQALSDGLEFGNLKIYGINTGVAS